VNLNVGVEGWFKFEKFKCDADGNEIPETRVIAADWFKNLITDNGLNSLKTNSSPFTFFHVGSGSAPPAITNTQLGSFIAGVTTQTSIQTGNSPSAPWYGFRRETRRFAAGVAAGNLAEVGVSSQETNGGLFSRALIVDSGGNPTTITVLGDESLDVTYELRFYAPVDDITGSITLNGEDYQWVSRARNANTAWVPTSFFGAWPGASWSSSSLTAVTSSPSLLSGSTGVSGASSVPSGPRARGNRTDWGLGSANSGTLKTLLVETAGVSGPRFQIEFTPPVPKNSSRILSLSYEIEWSRRP
jgi:hypothetical protein